MRSMGLINNHRPLTRPADDLCRDPTFDPAAAYIRRGMEGAAGGTVPLGGSHAGRKASTRYATYKLLARPFAISLCDIPYSHCCR